MKKHQWIAAFVLLMLLATAVFSATTVKAQSDTGAACWGQATKVFAQTGTLGKHAAEQPNPRLGLRNLARALYEEGVIGDDSMQALGVFVSTELGLSIEACQ